MAMCSSSIAMYSSGVLGSVEFASRARRCMRAVSYRMAETKRRCSSYDQIGCHSDRRRSCRSTGAGRILPARMRTLAREPQPVEGARR
jgi:hypothetical protein